MTEGLTQEYINFVCCKNIDIKKNHVISDYDQKFPFNLRLTPKLNVSNYKYHEIVRPARGDVGYACLELCQMHHAQVR